MRLLWYVLAAICALAGAGYVYLIASRDLSANDIPFFLAALFGTVVFGFLGHTSSPKARRNWAAKRPKYVSMPDKRTLFTHVFHQTMGAIGAFSPDDRAAMLVLLGSENPSGQDVLFEPYFASREWFWPEFERWNQRFSAENDYPESWASFLAAQSVPLNRKRQVFNLLMQTINARTDNFLTRRHTSSLSVAEEIIFAPESHTRYGQEVLARNREMVPPFFPGDATMLRIKQ